MPIQANIVQSATPTWTDAWIIWIIECELFVESNIDNAMGTSPWAWIQSWDPVYGRKLNSIPNVYGQIHMTLQGRKVYSGEAGKWQFYSGKMIKAQKRELAAKSHEPEESLKCRGCNVRVPFACRCSVETDGDLWGSIFEDEEEEE